MSAPRTRYLVVRILEACNADCFMCGYALSQDAYRFTLEDFQVLLAQTPATGIGYVRFTGGEPLLHRQILDLVRTGSAAGMRMSIITNGALLPQMIDALREAGLSQAVVSVDGASADTHNAYRNTPGLFERCVEGLAMARERGVLTRVNTVVGPHNYEEMPRLQRLVTDLDVARWELAAIKLGRPIAYRNPAHVRAVCDPIYEADPASLLIPFGKRFYGDAPDEQERFFKTGITPRPTPPACHLVGDVIYLDAKEGRGFGCSLLPHRSVDESGDGACLRTPSGWQLDTDEYRAHVARFRVAGPLVCTGCSPIAAGYSDLVARSTPVPTWCF